MAGRLSWIQSLIIIGLSMWLPAAAVPAAEADILGGGRVAWNASMAPMIMAAVPLQQAEKDPDKKTIRFSSSTEGRLLLSCFKLGLIAGLFVIWVWWIDWVNRDLLQFGDRLQMMPEVWNPIMVLSFMVAFAVVMFVPIFWVGYPIFVLGALLPPVVYSFVRRSRIKNDKNAAAAVRSQGKNVDGAFFEEELPADDGPEIVLSACDADSNEKKARLIRARQNHHFPTVKSILFDAQFKRAEQIMLNCGRDGASVQVLVDGIWHPFPPMDREMADGVVSAMKMLAGLNAADRRSTQTGAFEGKSDFGKAKLQLRTQGVATGEKVQVKFIESKKAVMKLDELGMFPEMIQQMQKSMNEPGMTIISAPPGHGLTSSWQGAIVSSHRLTRDCVGFYSTEETDTDIENIMPKPYDRSQGESPLAHLKKILLAQPDAVIVPEIDDPETLDLLVTQANSQNRSIIFRQSAASAVEAFLKVYAKSKNRNEFLTASRTVSCQRLLRRLCPQCRVERQVPPQTIQKLGGDPKKQRTIFSQFQLPPPEQRVDEKGDPIEFPPCPTCGGIGYIGRVAAFELLIFDDRLRDLVRKRPQVAAIEAATAKLGKKTINQQAYLLVLLGVTSLAEVQRIFNPPQRKPQKRNSR